MAVPVALSMLLAPAVNASLVAVMLRSAPADMRGRVTNTMLMAATALATLAPLVAGLLVQHASPAWAIGAFAAAMAAAAVIGRVLPGSAGGGGPRGHPGPDVDPAASAARPDQYHHFCYICRTLLPR